MSPAWGSGAWFLLILCVCERGIQGWRRPAERPCQVSTPLPPARPALATPPTTTITVNNTIIDDGTNTSTSLLGSSSSLLLLSLLRVIAVSIPPFDLYIKAVIGRDAPLLS